MIRLERREKMMTITTQAVKGRREREIGFTVERKDVLGRLPST